MVAAWSNELKIAKDLVERGVPVNARDVHGATALMSASQTCLDGKMVQLLLDARADPNAKSEANDTALTIAADNGNVVATEKLLKAEADPAVKHTHGKTAADEACGRGDKGHGDVCALLREALKK